MATLYQLNNRTRPVSFLLCAFFLRGCAPPRLYIEKLGTRRKLIVRENLKPKSQADRIKSGNEGVALSFSNSERDHHATAYHHESTTRTDNLQASPRTSTTQIASCARTDLRPPELQALTSDLPRVFALGRVAFYVFLLGASVISSRCS